MLKAPLYRVNLIAEHGQHKYTVNDSATFLPGVTGILNEINKPFLLQWAAKETALYMQKRISQFAHRAFEMNLDLLVNRAKKQHKFIKETAGRNGSLAHAEFESHIKNGLHEENPYSQSFLYWLKNNPLKIIAGDLKVASLKYEYGGSLDAIAETEEGKATIIDFKTGKSIHETHAYQTASYSYAFKETYGLNYYPECQIVRFEKNKPYFERRGIRDVHDSFKAFKAALDLYRAGQLIHFKDKEIMKEKIIKEKAK